MRKIFLLAAANLRKAKGQTAAMIMLIVTAALMLNLWLMLATDYKRNFDRYHTKLNAEHVSLAADGGEEMKEFLTGVMDGDERTVQYAVDEVMHMVASFAYKGGEINTEMIFLEKEAALFRPVGRVEILEEGEFTSGIYMPLLYRSEEIAVGKTVEISVGSRQLSYTVCGFFNSVMAGSHNCSLCEVLLTEDKYRELAESGCAPEALLCSVRIRDKGESEDYEAMLKNAVASRYPEARTGSNSYALVSQSRYISQMICSSLISVMAFFVLLIALAVTASNIVNYIQENMKNLGALKALGYTGGQLTGALQLQFLGITGVAVPAGAGLSYLLFPFLNVMMSAQTGIPYAVRFLPLPLLAAFVTLSGTVALTVWCASRRMKRVEPVTALRQDVATHSFKRNHVPLERTGIPLNVALAFKTALSGMKNNVTVCITMLVISLAAVFAGLMTENVINDMTPFIDMIVGETAHSCINVNGDRETDFLKMMRNDSRVEKVYLYHSEEIRHAGGVGLTAIVSDDFSQVNNREVVFEGRFPKYDNETALAAKYARENGLRVGDEIILTADGKEAAYIITGFTQMTNYLGKDCLLTRAGFERLGELQNLSFYLNLTEGTDIDAFHEEVKKRFGNGMNASINIAATVEGGSAVYVSLMGVIVAAVLILSGCIIAFVLFLLVRTMLNGKKRDYGILKALGFTTGQLILQTALSFMPAVVLSTVAGMIACSFIINPLTALFLRGIGIVKSTFTVPVGFVAAATAGLILFSFGVACLQAVKIRRISPEALLRGE